MPAQQINQPSNQIKLTNVSLVRLKKGKKRFEVACYKNTVTSFRAGNETELDNFERGHRGLIFSRLIEDPTRSEGLADDDHAGRWKRLRRRLREL